MKRYEPGVIRSEAEMFEEPNGEWVKYEDVKPELDRLEGDACDYSNWSNELYEENARLKELNRGMIIALKRVCKISCLYKDEGVPNLCGNCIVRFAINGDIDALERVVHMEVEEGMKCCRDCEYWMIGFLCGAAAVAMIALYIC